MALPVVPERPICWPPVTWSSDSASIWDTCQYEVVRATSASDCIVTVDQLHCRRRYCRLASFDRRTSPCLPNLRQPLIDPLVLICTTILSGPHLETAALGACRSDCDARAAALPDDRIDTQFVPSTLQSVPNAQPERIRVVHRIPAREPVRIEPAAEPDRVHLREPPRRGIIVPIPLVDEPRAVLPAPERSPAQAESPV